MLQSCAEGTQTGQMRITYKQRGLSLTVSPHCIFDFEIDDNSLGSFPWSWQL